MRLGDFDNFSDKFNSEVFNKLQNDYLNSSADNKTKEVADFVVTEIMVIFNNLIDNAPTIDAKTIEDCNIAYGDGYETARRLYERPQGELISRDELKEILSEEITRKFVRWDKTITVAEWETFIRDIIDNTPTIKEMPEKYIIQVKTKEDAQKIKNVWDKNNFGNVIITSDKFEVIPIRPQGEWIYTDKEDKEKGYGVYCSVCKCDMPIGINDWKQEYYESKFCPNCGAQMKTRTDAD